MRQNGRREESDLADFEGMPPRRQMRRLWMEMRELRLAVEKLTQQTPAAYGTRFGQVVSWTVPIIMLAIFIWRG